MRITAFIFILLLQVSCMEKEPNADPANYLSANEWMTSQFLDSMYKTAREFPDGVQFSIALVNDTVITYYGLIREEDGIKRIENHHSAFEIGSISKVFTASVLAEMAFEGQIDPGTSVSNYFDFEWKEGKEITFLQLANHTSGLPRVPDGMIWNVIFRSKNPYKDYNEQKLIRFLEKKIHLKSRPGEKFAYSNIGMGLLGYTLAKTQKQAYDDLLKESIFLPNEMKNTTANRNRAKGQLVTGLDRRGRPTSNWDLAALQGAGSVISTVEDLSKFVLSNFDENRKELVLQRQETFRMSEESAIAMGWFIRNREPETSIFWHNGGTGGYRSCLAMDVASRKAVVILSNISAGHKSAKNIDKLCFSLLEMIQ